MTQLISVGPNGDARPITCVYTAGGLTRCALPFGPFTATCYAIRLPTFGPPSYLPHVMRCGSKSNAGATAGRATAARRHAALLDMSLRGGKTRSFLPKRIFRTIYCAMHNLFPKIFEDRLSFDIKVPTYNYFCSCFCYFSEK